MVVCHLYFPRATQSINFPNNLIPGEWRAGRYQIAEFALGHVMQGK
jgi:hypothetical protein